MSDLDLSALRKVAEAATPGPWSVLGTGRSGGDHWYVCDEGEAIASISAQDGINEAQREPDATHMATFDPPTVLALLDELEVLRNWKAEALPVLSAWRKVWTAAGKPGRLGEPMAESTERWVENVQTTIEEDKRHFAKAWHDGAQWAAVELGAIHREENQWVTDSDNPYAEP